MLAEFLTVLAGFFRFYSDVKSFIQFRQQYTDTQWENEGQELTKAIKGATTDDERRALVRRLADHNSSA